jgi:hypothetical protein
MGSNYRFRREGPFARGVHVVSKFLGESKSALVWVLVVAAFQLISCWTNILGLLLVLPWSAAVLLGIGIQGMAIYAGLGLIGAAEENRGGWLKLLAPVVALSVAFSYMGFASNYLADQERRKAPMEARDDLVRQASSLGSAIDEARRTSGAIYANRADYARQVMSRVRARQARGDYASPAEGEATLAQWQTELDTAETALREWSQFQFDPSMAINAASVPAGFEVLQRNHRELARLVGMLRVAEAKQVRMPPIPVASARATQSTQAKSPVELALVLLFTAPGVGWLLLSAMLEFVPLMAAHATSQKPFEDEEDEAWAADASKNPWAILPRGPEDAALAREITAFNSLVRPVSLAGSFADADIGAQEEKLRSVIEAYREAHVEKLRNVELQKRLEFKEERLEMLLESAKRHGVPASLQMQLVEEYWRDVMGDFNVEMVRQEKERDERRDTVFQPGIAEA